MKLHEKIEFARVTTFLTMVNMRFTVAGGYPRDINFNVEPRDLDICIFGSTEEQMSELVPVVRSQLEGADLLNGVSYTENDEPVSMSGDDRVYDVLKTNAGIDLIFWGERYRTMQDVLDGFDYNINQFSLDFDSFGNAVGIYHGNMATFGTLTRLRDDSITDAREDKMEQLARLRGWKLNHI